MTTLAPRFIDTFEPKPAAVLRTQDAQDRLRFSGIVGPLLMNDSRRWQNRNYVKTTEQLKSFRYWNYIAVTKIAERCGQQMPIVSRRTRGGGQFAQGYGPQQVQHLRRNYNLLQHVSDDLEPVENHPLVDLLLRVNPEDTWHEFMADTVKSLRLTGRFYWWLIPNAFRTQLAPGGLPAELWVMPANWVTAIFNDDGTFRHWLIVPDNDESRRMELPFDQIIQGRYKDPAAIQEAHSPVQAAPIWIDNVEAIEQARRSGFANGVNPDVIVEMDPERYAEPSPALIERIKQRFMERTTEGGLQKRNGEPLIVPPGTTAKPWSHTNREMDFTVSADQMRDNNLALQGVPPVIAGVTSDYTRATADAANVVFCDQTINPTLRFIAGVATEKLASLYGPDLVVWFADCVPADAAFELELEKAGFAMGARFPNEVRSRHGLEPVEGEPAYESGYLGSGLSPLNEDLQPEPLPDDQFDPANPPDEDEEDEDEQEDGDDDE